MQIRSHLQKYFERIKREFETDDPMEFIRKDLCDTSKVYKFDKAQLDQEIASPKSQNFTGVYQNSSISRNNRSQENPEMQNLIPPQKDSDQMIKTDPQQENIHSSIKKRNLKASQKRKELAAD